ncbi:hypothetical protein [Brevundimonas lutea]|uniref:hypothetical protein n=1 Tax=Brevundimonas lutea TaxID=2293980 RepID=UPI0013CEA712|nr:hypothetical protein [Brevundimonas lutea]
MFETPPTWAIPIANLTQWFDWNAIETIGTVATLLVAVSLATRDSRDRRAAKAALIVAAIQPIAVVVKTINQQWDLGKKLSQAPEVVFNRLIKIDVLDEMRVTMLEIRLAELPTARSIDAFSAARAALKNIKAEGIDLCGQNPSLLNEWIPGRVDDLTRYHHALVEEALRFTSKRKLLEELAPKENRSA